MIKNFFSRNKILNSKFVSNGIWLYLLQFFNTIIPLVTIPYITRVLGVKGYGIFSTVVNICAYFQVIIEYGFNLTATREVALLNSDKKLNKVFSLVFFSRIILFLLCIVFIVVIMLFNKNNNVYLLCLIIFGVGLLAYCFQTNWLFQGKQEMKYISISNIISRIITTVAIFIYVKGIEDIYIYCILYVLSPFLSNFIGLIICLRKYHIRLVKITIKDCIDMLRRGAYIFFSNLSGKIFGSIGITFLAIFREDYEVGLYSALYKIPFLILLLWNPISQIIYPNASERITKNFKEGFIFVKKMRRFFLCSFIIFSLVVMLFLNEIIILFLGTEYCVKSYIIYPLLIWVILGINNNFWGIQILVGAGYDKLYSQVFQIGVIFSVLFNLLFVYIWGVEGAAIAPALSEFIISILLYVKIRKIVVK